jgi:hypothetical protein
MSINSTSGNTNGQHPTSSAEKKLFADLKRRLEALTYEEREELIKAGGDVLARLRATSSAKVSPAKPRARASGR